MLLAGPGRGAGPGAGACRADARAGQVAPPASDRPRGQVVGRARDRKAGRGCGTATSGSELAADEASVSGYLEGRLLAAHEHLDARIAAALPGLPGELRRRRRPTAGRVRAGSGRCLLLLAVFVGLGIVRRVAVRSCHSPRPATTPLARRLHRRAARLKAVAIASSGRRRLLCFARRQHRCVPVVRPGRRSSAALVLGYLAGRPGRSGRLVACRLLFAPGSARPAGGADERRSGSVLDPLDGPVRGLVRLRLRHDRASAPLGVSLAAQLLAYVLGLGLLGIALHLVWRAGWPPPAGRWSAPRSWSC